MSINIRGYEPVIGIEVHVQLKTKSKIFCGDSTQFNGGDNENTSPVSVGMPGALPVLNRLAIDYSIKTGLALNCQIRKKSIFSRKNYFYPDLPKGYQISQYDLPLCENGNITFIVDGIEKKVSITRAHMEEDAGKSIHQGDCTLLNYNRAGIPLLEIVSGPDMHTAKEAAAYGKTILQLVRYLDVCDGNLEEGSLRCDCNVSVRKIGTKTLGTKVELKNLNSFRFIEKAIDYEIDRQIDEIELGKKIIQETRLYDPDKNKTYSMRAKENAEDYRYFPDPDLLPLIVSDQEIELIKNTIPELPLAKAVRYRDNFELSSQDIEVLTAEKEIADYFEKTANFCGNYKAAANWVMVELLRELNNNNKISILHSPVQPESLGKLISLIDKGEISGKIAKTIFLEMWKTSAEPKKIIAEKGLVPVNDRESIIKIIDSVLANNPTQVAEYQAGKLKVFGFFVGAVMKASSGQANPDKVNEILKQKLGLQ